VVVVVVVVVGDNETLPVVGIVSAFVGPVADSIVAVEDKVAV